MKSLLPAILLASAVVPAHAGALFSDDFNQAETPAGLVQWQGGKHRVNEASGAWLEISVDSDNTFGYGTDNRVLAIHDRSETDQVNLLAAVKGAGDVVTVSFDFLEPEGSAQGPLIVRVGTGDNSDQQRAVNTGLRDGRMESSPENSYTPGLKHRLTLVVNNSPDTVAYGGRSLQSQHYDAYIGDRLVLDGLPFDTKDNALTPGTPLDALRLLTYTDITKDQTILIDNVKVESGAQKP